MPTSDSGKAIASRNATTHGLFARDVVLPSLGEDPEGYRQLQDEWANQLVPRNLLEQHYVEKIAAASWRLRRFHRWQAQLFEDDSLTEDQRVDRLDKVMRHETALQRQIDTAVRMLGREAPQLYRQRVREQVLEGLLISERECRDEPEVDSMVEQKVLDRLLDLRGKTAQAAAALTHAPLDTTAPDALPEVAAAEVCQVEICQNELLPAGIPAAGAGDTQEAETQAASPLAASDPENCQNELPENEQTLQAIAKHPSRVREFLDPTYPYRPPTYHGLPGRRRKGVQRGQAA